MGATQINPGSTVHDPESACEQVIYSGGGFSNVFPLPGYQKDAVANYFKNYKPVYNSTQYNNSQITRGFPDLRCVTTSVGINFLASYLSFWGDTVRMEPIISLPLMESSTKSSGRQRPRLP